jgi:hypothetical protein
MELKSPPPSTREAPPEADTTTGPVNVDAPLLLAGVRDGARASLVLVGETLPEGVRPFPDPTFPEDSLRLAELTAPGAGWTLFSEGVRVGSLTVSEAGPAPGFCARRTQVSGVVELVPEAAGATRLLALPASVGRSRAYGAYQEVQHDYDQRVATLTIAGDYMRENAVPRPPLGVLDARDAIQAFRPGPAQNLAIAATFVHEDSLGIGSPGQGAYALFVMGQGSPDGYQEAFTWYRSVDAEGKGIPRYFDHLDLDGDGSDEIVLDVFGSDRRWFAVLDRTEGGWERSFQDGCGSGTSRTN